MRLRTLTEAECRARLYGGGSADRVDVVRVLPRRTKGSSQSGERLRELFEQRLDTHGPEAEAA
jgi:hypothetical protein